MTRDVVLFFRLCVLAGPLIFAPVLQLHHSLTRVLALAVTAALVLVLARVTRGHEAWLAWVLAPRLAWVRTAAMVTAALRDRGIAPQTRRCAPLAGLLATPFPWFGRATARTMLT